MKLHTLLSKIVFLSFLSLAFISISCKDDNKEPETIDNNEIVGKWQLTSVTPETAGTSIPALALIPVAAPCAYALVFSFSSDNKVVSSGCDAAITVLTTTGYLTVGSTTTWKVENGNLLLTTGRATQSLPIKQNDDEMTLAVNTATTGPAVNALLLFKRI